ncbi:membrane protein [Gordonia jinhuaensis]|uniref:Membrane protein n=1 Tax=Gordonia jinhuaensis TaxID=1517702 RepID=A0A916T9X3_9ACTN|nr:hypothetical protein [Gordonia jinhuaensis]GGB35518.1 membrane protein [Gordonia jinhuaensis]
MTVLAEAKRALLVVAALAATLSVLLIAFALPAVKSGPHRLPVALVASASDASQIREHVESATPGAISFRTARSQEQAQTMIDHRDVDGAIVVEPAGVTTLVGSAAGVSVATAVEGVGSAVAAGRPHQVLNVRPFPSGDPRGVGLSAGALPLALGGWIGALVIMAAVRRPSHVVAAVVGFSVVGAIALTVVMRYVIGTYDTGLVAVTLAAVLAFAATAFGVIGLRSLLGVPGLVIAALALIVVGNPLSGLSSAPELLPSPWGTIGQLLPPGATGSLLRNVEFFNGHAITQPVVVLCAWLLVGLALYALALRRTVALRRTASAPAPVAGGGRHEAPESDGVPETMGAPETMEVRETMGA